MWKKTLVIALVLALFALLALPNSVMSAVVKGEYNDTESTVNTTTTTTVNVGEIYQGTVGSNVHQTESYVWGHVKLSQTLLNQIAANHNSFLGTALNKYASSTTLASNSELLTSSFVLDPAFLYYTNYGNPTYQNPTAVTYGAYADEWVRDATIPGRTASYSSTTTGSPEVYKISSTTTSGQTVTYGPAQKVGDNVVINRHTTNWSKTEVGQAQINYYSVSAYKYVSPLVLDMNNDSKLEASGGNWLPHNSVERDNLMAYDFNGTGFPVLMEWAGPNDGLLVVPNADGSIDGTCFFGTVGGFNNGFEKLSTRDANQDIQISGDELKGIMVWQDKNQNGAAEKTELASVESLGITSLSLKYNNMKGEFTRNGKTNVMWDWWPSALNVRSVDAQEK